MPDLGKAELALHDRMTMACAAASDAGLPGQFCAWRQDGLLAVSATAPELAFLSAVSGINPSTVSSAIQLIATSDWGDDGPTMISSPERDGAHAVAQSMRAAGLARAPDRVVAIRHLSDDNPPAGPAPFEDVLADSPAATFVPVLLGGYRVDGAVAAFIAAEHRLAAVRRYLLISAGVAVAAAAMSIHGDVAVLGGAATLPGHRGQGAQTRLLQHRLWAAREAGCRLATATAAPNSASARNLARAGFTLVHRPAWHRPVSHPSPTPPAGQAPPLVVDYTCAEAVLGNVTLAVDAGVHAVVGSSGLTALDYAELDQRARGRGVGVIAAGNFSLLAALLPAACRLAGCDDGPNSATVCPSISQGTLSVCAQGTESTAPRRSTPC